jgi:hypothetical protein
VNRSEYNDLVGKPEVNKSLGRPKTRWDYNINIWIFDNAVEGA